MSDEERSDPPPVLRILRGRPDDPELAAVVAVLSAAGRGEPAPEPALRSGWRDPWFGLRRPLRPGPGAWRNSLR